MEMIDNLINTGILIIIVLIASICVGGISIFLLKKRKRRFKGVYESSLYSSLDRCNSKDFVKIDDIIDDVIITDGWSRFIAVIDCAGFDFYSMSLQEQMNTAKNYMPFINTINEPITYRQYCTSADMEDALIRYHEALQKVLASIKNVCLQIDDVSNQLNIAEKEEDKQYFSSSLDILGKQLDVLEFRRLHLLDQIEYIEQNSGDKAAPLLSETYVVEWDKSKLDSADSLSNEELFMKARVELNTLVSNKIHSLYLAGVKAKRCQFNDLIDMFRRHSLPVSSERFKKSDIRRTVFDADIITSDSIHQYQILINDQRKAAMRQSTSDMVESMLNFGLDNSTNN